MINARNYTKAITSRASQLGFRLAFQTHQQGYSWQWKHGHLLMPVVGWADPSDKVAALCCACEDLARAMGWEYTEA